LLIWQHRLSSNFGEKQRDIVSHRDPATGKLYSIYGISLLMLKYWNREMPRSRMEAVKPSSSNVGPAKPGLNHNRPVPAADVLPHLLERLVARLVHDGAFAGAARGGGEPDGNEWPEKAAG
jgi:hypothetical protein